MHLIAPTVICLVLLAYNILFAWWLENGRTYAGTEVD
jgi:hypothetical protein